MTVYSMCKILRHALFNRLHHQLVPLTCNGKYTDYKLDSVSLSYWWNIQHSQYVSKTYYHYQPVISHSSTAQSLYQSPTNTTSIFCVFAVITQMVWNAQTVSFYCSVHHLRWPGTITAPLSHFTVCGTIQIVFRLDFRTSSQASVMWIATAAAAAVITCMDEMMTTAFVMLVLRKHSLAVLLTAD